MEQVADDADGWRRGLAGLGALAAAALLSGLGYAVTSGPVRVGCGIALVVLALAVPVVALLLRRRYGLLPVRPRLRKALVGVYGLLAVAFGVQSVVGSSARWLNAALAAMWALQLVRLLREPTTRW